jgi:hypothetical protein
MLMWSFKPCLYMDVGLASVVIALRTCTDVARLAHVLLQFRLAWCDKLVWDARFVKGICFDLFIIRGGNIAFNAFWRCVMRSILSMLDK